MPDEERLYVSKITTSQGTFYLKDSEARGLISAISGQITFHLCTEASNTPIGVSMVVQGTTVTGTMVPATNTGTAQKPVWEPQLGYYLVRQTYEANSKDYFSEYVVVHTPVPMESSSYGGYHWEKLGDTEIDFSSLGQLAYKDSVTLNKQTDLVLGRDTNLYMPNTSCTIGTPTTDTFVKSYPGTTQKLQTTSITGTNGTESVSKVTKSSVTATNTVLGTDTTASKVTKVAKTATNLVLGTNTTASKATFKGIWTVGHEAASATNVSRIALSTGNTSILEKATVDTSTETLTLSTASVTQSSVKGCVNATSSLAEYEYEDVTVPVVTSNTAVNFDAVSTITDVTVPVITSNDEVTANTVSISNVNVAKAASTATVVATGQTTATDTNGASVLTGLGTATTASAITGAPTVNVPQTTITKGYNDDVTVLTDATTITVS